MLIFRCCILSSRFLLNHAKLVRIMSSENKRIIIGSSATDICPKKRVRRSRWLDAPTVAQTAGSLDTGNRNNLPTLPAVHKESIKHKKKHKGRMTERIPKTKLVPCTVEFQLKPKMHSKVVNPFYKPAAINNARKISTTAVSEQQLSNVSFNRNASADSQEKKHSGYTTEEQELIGEAVRKWTPTQLGTIIGKAGGGRRPGLIFTLMNYNVLAQDLLEQHPELYRRHSNNFLNWRYRWSRLLADFKKHNSDILCLQEVQNDHWEEYYVTQLTELGYTGLYKQRTGKLPDGCAIFYKHDIFKLVESTVVEFHQPDSQLLDRGNVGIVAKFAPLEKDGVEVVVATTHLLYNPKREDVRVAQTQLLLTEIDRMSYKQNTKYVPIIVTGDFNSLPDSLVVNLIKHGSLNYKTMTRKRLKTKNNWLPIPLGVTDNCQHMDLVISRRQKESLTRKEELNLIQIRHPLKTSCALNQYLSPDHFSTGILNHNFIFKSVYDHVVQSQIEATTYQDAWVTVDYMFYSTKMDPQNKIKKDDKLVLLSKYSLPMKSHLKGITIPNRELGSDHMALLAKFKLEF